MIKNLFARAVALCLGCSSLSSLAAEFTLDLEATNVVPSTRGTANTTYFGWDNFEAPTANAWLEDTTPDVGDTGIVGVKFETTNGQLHRASSGNFYAGHLPTAAVAELVTVTTNGTPGTDGKTTIIVQLVGTGNFPASWTFGTINDVEPVVVQGSNGANLGQVWVKWVIDGNAPTYQFTIGATSSQHMSFDRIEIDTLWSPTAQRDSMDAKTVKITTESLAMGQEGEAYSAQLAATGDGTPFTWTLKAESTLPEGLALGDDGLISGTPLTYGQTTFTVVVTDADEFDDEATYTLYITPTPVSAQNWVLTQENTHVVPAIRGSGHTTHFGWDSFGALSTPIDDTTPDIGAVPPAVVRFRTTNAEDHTSGSGNYYSYSSPPAEEVTVVTNGIPGTTGKTTIIAQMVTLFGGFPSDYIMGTINGVEATVVQGTNKAGKGQLWAVWELEGNAETYTFTISGAPDTSAYSFDKIEIDTHWSLTGAATDEMILAEPTPLASILEQVTGVVAPSSRGTNNTTYFGWETFGVSGPATVINDNTPDIGSDPTGLARFQTMNDEIHQFSGGGNLYLLSFDPEVDLTLDERITVPTDGVVGEAGFTTIILQIASASSGMGGASFANEIYIGPINDVEPTVIQGAGATTAQLWAKWEIPGNQTTYTIDIHGVPNQQHYSFDRVVVDTKYSPYGYVADTMREKTVEITTEVLADAIKGAPYTAQLEATGGNPPHVWTLAEESTLPEGLSLSTDGLISGTPVTLGSVTFTVIATDGDDYHAEATYLLNVVSGIKIVSTDLPIGVIGKAYSATLLAEDGLAPYTWTLTEGTLPEGLSLSEAGEISGVPTAAAEALLTFTVTDDEESPASQEFTLVISPTVLKPVLNPIVFAPTSPGADFTHTVTAANYPEKFIITGLPKGLKYAADTGVISGKTTVAGVYMVQARASNSAGTSVQVTAPLIVKALAPAVVGTFTGLIERDPTANANLGSTFSLTTTTTGAFTLQVKSAAAAQSVKGFLNGSAPQVSVDVGGNLLSLTLNAETQLVSGTHGAATVEGWRTVWDKKFNPVSTREGYYSVALDLADEEDLEDETIPHGIGFSTITVASAGTLKITGKTADGQVITSASPLGPNGEIAVYAALYAKKGSLLGQWNIAEDPEGLFMDNNVSGDLTWLKPETKGRAYAGAFGPVELAAEGGYLGFSAKGPVVLGLPETGDMDIRFTGGGVDESDTNPDVIGAVWTEAYAVNFSGVDNPGAVSLKVNKASGAISGSFSLQDTEPTLIRKGVKFQGQIVRLSDGEIKAAGWFLLPQIPGEGETAKDSPILSGAFSIEQAEAP